MKKISVIFAMLLALLGAMRLFPTSALASTFPNVKQINEDTYAGRTADNYYLGLVRVTNENLDFWIRYADKQNRVGARTFLPGFSTAGSGHFEGVLQDYQKDKIKQNYNELWIAFATTEPIQNIISFPNESAIEMFVTVLTSPKALITSHMGINRSTEAAQKIFKDPKLKRSDQSIHLHSFAAKVMSMRDPKKVYMLTAPAEVMRAILVKKMPAHTVFIGDNFYQQSLEKYEKGKEGEYRSDYALLRGDEAIKLLKTNPPRVELEYINGKYGGANEFIKKFTIFKPDGSLLISFGQDTHDYQWLFTPPFNNLIQHPYTLVDLQALASATNLIPYEGQVVVQPPAVPKKPQQPMEMPPTPTSALTAEPKTNHLKKIFEAAALSQDMTEAVNFVSQGIMRSITDKDCAYLQKFADLTIKRLTNSFDFMLVHPNPNTLCGGIASCSFTSETSNKIKTTVRPWVEILNVLFDTINKATNRSTKTIPEIQALETLLKGDLCERSRGVCRMKNSYKTDIASTVYVLNSAVNVYIKDFANQCALLQSKHRDA